MNPRRTYFASVVLAVGLLWSAPTIAQRDDVDPEEQRGPETDEVRRQRIEAHQDLGDVDQGAPDTRQAHQPETAARRHTFKLKKLQEAIKRRLGLKKDQAKTIDQLFGIYFASLQDRRGRSRSFGTNPDAADRVRNLRDKMIEARKTGNEKEARELREQFRQMMQTRSTAVALSASQFLKKVAAELDDKQSAVFWQLVRRLRVGASPGARGGGLRTLWRAAMRPEVALSDQQRRTIARILRDGLGAVAKVERYGDQEKVEQVTAQVRAAVFKELSADQRPKVEATLTEHADRNRPRERASATQNHRKRQPDHEDEDEDENLPEDPEPQEHEKEPDEGLSLSVVRFSPGHIS